MIRQGRPCPLKKLNKCYLLSLPFPIQFHKMERKKTDEQNCFSKSIAKSTDDDYSSINIFICCVNGQLRDKRGRARQSWGFWAFVNTPESEWEPGTNLLGNWSYLLLKARFAPRCCILYTPPPQLLSWPVAHTSQEAILSRRQKGRPFSSCPKNTCGKIPFWIH